MKKYIFIIILPLCSFAQNTTQNILLDSGWSIFSTHIIPNNNNIVDVFESIINDVIIIKDINGNVYWPEFGLNSIGSIEVGSAY